MSINTIIEAVAVLAKRDYKIQDLYEKMMQEGYISHLDGEILLELEEHDNESESYPIIRTTKHLGDKKQKSKVRDSKNIHKDKAKHGQSKWHHADKMYLAGNDIHGTFKTRKQKEAMDQREKDVPDKYYSALALSMISIKKLYMQVQNRMTKSIQEITLEILDMVAHFELTAEIMDSIEEEVDALFHDEVNYMYYLKWEIEQEEAAIRRLELQLRAKRDIVAKTKQELWEIQNT